MIASPRLSARVFVALGLFICLSAFPSATQAEDAGVLPRADAAAKSGDFAAAKALYQQIYAEYGANNSTPGRQALNSYIVMQLGKCCTGLRQLSDARTWYEKAIATFPTDTAVCADAQYQLGLVYQKMGDKSRAKDELEKVVTRYPEERGMGAYALLRKAKIDMQPGRYASAVETLRRLVRDYADKPGVHYEASRLMVDALDNDLRINDAVSVLDAMLAKGGYSREQIGDLLVQKAYVQLRADRYTDCKATCERLAKELAGWKRFETQMKHLEAQVLVMDGSDPDRALTLIEELRRLPWLRERSNLARFEVMTGACYWQKGDRTKAEEHFDKVINDYADQKALVSEAYYHRARVRIWAKDYEAAAKDIPPISSAYLRHFTQGEWHFHQGALAAAAAEYELVATTLPSHRVSNYEPMAALNRLASCYSDLRKESEAEAVRKKLDAYKAGHN